jgi:transcriptional regulator with XRE-family HTH domain
MPRGSSPQIPQRGLGKAVRHLREEAKLTQLRLALKAGVSSSWLSRIEGGKVDPTWDTMRKLSTGLDVSMEALADAAERFEGEEAR